MFAWNGGPIVEIEQRNPAPMLVEYDEGPEVDPGAAPMLDQPVVGRAMQGVERLVTARRSTLGRLTRWVFGALFSLVLSVAAWNFVTGLFAANPVLGWIALVLCGLAIAILLIAAFREFAAFARTARLDTLRQQAVTARAEDDLAAARRTVVALQSLYASRAETAWGLARLAERQAEVFDADALLAMAEIELVGPLDAAARAQIEAAARQVATVTALVPITLADVAIVLFANLRMIRRVAEIYGGRSGSFGSFAMLSRVFGSLVATGAVALTDDLLGSVAGGGVIAKLSRRFGEGVVNGALTARIGVAAMELCRPLPFVATAKPGVSAMVSRALTGLFGRAPKSDDAA